MNYSLIRLCGFFDVFWWLPLITAPSFSVTVKLFFSFFSPITCFLSLFLTYSLCSSCPLPPFSFPAILAERGSEGQSKESEWVPTVFEVWLRNERKAPSSYLPHAMTRFILTLPIWSSSQESLKNKIKDYTVKNKLFLYSIFTQQ